MVRLLTVYNRFHLLHHLLLHLLMLLLLDEKIAARVILFLLMRDIHSIRMRLLARCMLHILSKLVHAKTRTLTQ